MSNTMTAPLVVPPSGTWLGVDGNWSTFTLSIGTPEQLFQVLPSTINSEIWVPQADGCVPYMADLRNCSATRGVVESTGRQGYQSNVSTSWRQIGIYQLVSERALFPDENGLYGLEQIRFSSGLVKAPNQTVAGIASQHFWLGSIGLADEAAAFNVVNGNLPSLISTLASEKMIPSTSFGYTAGASYRSSPGNLVLGGYDSARVKLDNISFDIPSGNSILVNLASIVATNSLVGTASMLVSTTGLTMKVDSTISQLWLPASVCDQMAKAFGLLYDASTNLYLVNSTMRSKLQQLAPQLTFTIAQGPSSGKTTNIVFPYAAFDMSIGLPTYTTDYFYFPIRRAANETQYVLGRTFLQEAYIIVDWERKKFSVGQTQHGSDSKVVTIESMDQVSSMVAQQQGRPTSAVIGGVIGGTLLVVVVVILLLYRLRQKRQSAELIEEQGDEKHTADTLWHAPDEHNQKGEAFECVLEAMSEPRHELGDDAQTKLQLMSTTFYELPGAPVSQELSIDQRSS